MVTPDEWHAAVREHQAECYRYSKTEEYRQRLAAHQADLAALGISSTDPEAMYRESVENFLRREQERQEARLA